MTVGTARMVFDSYAAMDAPTLPVDPWSALQVRLARWQVAQFGVTSAMHDVLGIVEEVGELASGLCGYTDALDGLCDALIFTMQLCTSLRLDAGVLIAAGVLESATPERDDERPLLIAMSDLAHAVLKNANGIRGLGDRDAYREAAGEAVIRFVAALIVYADDDTDEIATRSMATLLERVETVAEQVMGRRVRELPASKLTGSKCAGCGAHVPLDHACLVSPATGEVWCGDVCAKSGLIA